MEIERKFLIKEKNKTYSSPFEINELKKEILDSGKKIIQSYLPKKLCQEILKKLNKKINFKPNQLRIRQYGKDYFLTIKSKGILERNEFEMQIPKKYYDELLPLRKKTLEKIRLVKKVDGNNFDIDYYPIYSLIVIEIEFTTVKEATEFKTDMKEVTGKRKYSNRHLAK